MRAVKLVMAVWLLNVIAPMWLVQGQEARSTDGKTASPADGLTAEQIQVAERFKKLEDLLLRSAELESAENPTRSALLQQAAQLGKQTQLADLLARAATSLEKKQFSQAIDDQKTSRENLKRLLELLQSENRGERVREQRDQVRRWIEETDRLLRLQRSLSGRTEGGQEMQQAAGDQVKLADKAAQIAADLAGKKPEETAPKSPDQQAEKAGDRTESKSPEDPSKGDDESDAKPAADGKSDDNQQNPKAPKDGKPESGKEENGDKDAAGKDSEKESGSAESDKKPAADPKDKGKPQGESSDSQSKPGEASESPPSPGEQKPGEQKPGQPPSGKQKSGEQKSGEQKSGEQKSGEQKSGEQKSGEQQSGEQPSGQSPSSQQPPESKDPAERAKQRIEQAQKKMQEAQQALEDAQRKGAVEKQREAEEELRAAIEELEEILRQLREEEIERSLASLETRLRRMLEMQTKVLDETNRLQEITGDQATRQIEIRASNLALEERKILAEGERAFLLLREEGSSAAFPEAIEQVNVDISNVAERLAKADIGKLTITIEQEIVSSLEEMVAALAQIQKEKKEKKQQQQGQPQQGEPGDQPLVDKLAELRLIRTLQIRINKRTDALSQMLEDPADAVGQVKEADILGEVKGLAERQANIQQVTRDIVVGADQ